MVVKYYSETLNKMFDKKEDLEKAEKDFEEANKKKLEAEKRALEKQEAKNKERAADAEVVQKAYDEMIEKSKKAKEAEENYLKVKRDFISKHGSYHITYSNIHDTNVLEIISDLLDNIFR